MLRCKHRFTSKKTSDCSTLFKYALYFWAGCPGDWLLVGSLPLKVQRHFHPVSGLLGWRRHVWGVTSPATTMLPTPPPGEDDTASTSVLKFPSSGYRLLLPEVLGATDQAWSGGNSGHWSPVLISPCLTRRRTLLPVKSTSFAHMWGGCVNAHKVIK